MQLTDFAPKRQATHLSDVRSTMIRQVVDDLKWMSRQEKLRFNPSVWGVVDGGVCEVCLAGASILRRELRKDAIAAFSGVNGKTIDRCRLSTKVWTKTLAIDALRCGFVSFFIHNTTDGPSALRLSELPKLPSEYVLDTCRLSLEKIAGWCVWALKLADAFEKQGC